MQPHSKIQTSTYNNTSQNQNNSTPTNSPNTIYEPQNKQKTNKTATPPTLGITHAKPNKHQPHNLTKQQTSRISNVQTTLTLLITNHGKHHKLASHINHQNNISTKQPTILAQNIKRANHPNSPSRQVIPQNYQNHELNYYTVHQLITLTEHHTEKTAPKSITKQ